MTLISTSTAAFFERSRLDIKSLRAQAESVQAQISRGERLARSSDDPVAASRLRNLARAERLSEIDTANANRASADLTLADTALTAFSDNIIRARELAILAGNDPLSEEQRASIGNELAQIHANLFQLANSRDSAGHALFGGETPGNAYELDGDGNAVYIGTGTSGELGLGEGQTVKRGLTGPEFLSFNVNGTPTDLMAVVKGLADTLQSGAPGAAATARDTLAALDTGLDAVTTGQTVVGTRLSWIEMTADRRVQLSELRATEQAEIGGINVASAIADLQEAMLVLEASQASFGRLSTLNLFSKLG